MVLAGEFALEWCGWVWFGRQSRPSQGGKQRLKTATQRVVEHKRDAVSEHHIIRSLRKSRKIPQVLIAIASPQLQYDQAVVLHQNPPHETMPERIE